MAGLSRAAVALLLVVALLNPAWAEPAPPELRRAEGPTPVMQPARLDAVQIASWFLANPARAGVYALDIDVLELAELFLEEGEREGVAGDLAFAQSVLETGSFSYPAHGQVRAHFNNYAGLGACDGGACTVARFPTPRIGVRAQIHHLRAYADPTVTRDTLASPLASPRFELVQPKGRAPNWEDMGGSRPGLQGVNWASDPRYSHKILALYDSMLAFAVEMAGTTLSFLDVLPGSFAAQEIEWLAATGITRGSRDRLRFDPEGLVSRGQLVSFLYRLAGEPEVEGTVPYPDVAADDVHATAILWAATEQIVGGYADGRFGPGDPLTRGQMVSLLHRLAGEPDEASATPFVDVDGSVHATAIAWAAATGITLGVTPERFEPQGEVTRAQMAVFLYRFARLMGLPTLEAGDPVLDTHAETPTTPTTPTAATDG